MEKEFSYKISMEPTPEVLVIGTSQAMDSYSTWQEEPVSGIATCRSVTTRETYVDGSSVAYKTELTAGMNPRSGCQYPLTDLFKYTTAFERDNSYNNSLDSLRYNLTLSAVSYFSKTFSESGLRGDQFAVACTAFCQQELGHKFYILVYPNETALLAFCKGQKWNYVIVNHAYT